MKLIKGMILGSLIGLTVGLMVDTDEALCIGKKCLRRGRRFLNSLVNM